MYKVCIYIDNHPRSRRIGDALIAGAIRMRWNHVIMDQSNYTEVPQADLVVSYGWLNRTLFESYKHFIYVDLGYWSRKQYRSDYNGFHKCVLDARHPTKYFQRNRGKNRITVDAPTVSTSWRRKGTNIVLAGMSAKGAISMGFEPMVWERRIIEKIKRISNRPIIYRPKPSWKNAQQIDGTIFSPAEQSIEDVLKDAYILITNYSNAALDALAAGVPIYAADGPATVLSTESLESIETPRRDGDRQQFINDISYCHWTKDEIASGVMFRQFIDDGLLVL